MSRRREGETRERKRSTNGKKRGNHPLNSLISQTARVIRSNEKALSFSFHKSNSILSPDE